MILWQKMVMLYLGMALSVLIIFPAAIFNNPTVLSLYDLTPTTWENAKTLGFGNNGIVGDFSGAVNNSQELGNTQSSGVNNNTFFLIDALFAVMQSIISFFAILFSPFLLLGYVDAPTIIKMFVGIPLVTMLLVGLLGFIRGTG